MSNYWMNVDGELVWVRKETVVSLVQLLSCYLCRRSEGKHYYFQDSSYPGQHL